MEGKIIVELQDTMGSDSTIAGAAWTSTYNKDRRSIKMDDATEVERVVNMLADSGHGVPFESVIFRFWIRFPIFTDRQHMTHRIGSHNGLSGRYRTVPDDFYAFPDDCRAILNRFGQGSDLGTAEKIGDVWASEFDNHCAGANAWYRDKVGLLKILEKNGQVDNAEFKRIREILRGMLPQANMTERTSILNLRSFANYIRLRNNAHAQPEIRSVAAQMLKQVQEQAQCPVALAALERNGWRV